MILARELIRFSVHARRPRIACLTMDEDELRYYRMSKGKDNEERMRFAAAFFVTSASAVIY